MSKLKFAKLTLVSTLLFSSLTFTQAEQVADNRPVFNLLTYTDMVDFQVLSDLIPKFENLCKCKVNLETTKQGFILNSVLSAYSKAKYDAVIGLDINDATRIMTDKKINKAFAKVNYDIKDLNNLGYGLSWNNPKVQPVSNGPITVVYNKDKVIFQGTMYNSFKDWIENNTNSYIMATPERNDLAKNLARIIAVYYPTYAEKVAAWTKIKSHTVTVGSGWSSSYGVFMKGESETALGYGTSIIYHRLVDKDYRFENLNFKDGMPYLVDSIAILANTKKMAIAQQFAKFMLTPEAQKTLFMKNATYPVIKFKDGEVSGEQKELADSISQYKVKDLRFIPQADYDDSVKAFKEVFAK